MHCSQGVSRSVTLVVAYLMWKLGKTYYEVFETVKAVRGVASPNIGFSCQVCSSSSRRQHLWGKGTVTFLAVLRLEAIYGTCMHVITAPPGTALLPVQPGDCGILAGVQLRPAQLVRSAVSNVVKYIQVLECMHATGENQV